MANGKKKSKKSSKGTGAGPLKGVEKLNDQPAVKMGAHHEAVQAQFQKAGFSLSDFTEVINALTSQQSMALIQLILNTVMSKKG